MRRLLSFSLVLFACSGQTPNVPGPTENGKPGNPGKGAVDPGCVGPSCGYSGTGFVVHEWGTNTFVVGTDGSTLRGLHHEEEDLPSFVYDRIKQGSLPGMESSVEAKMETPVTYFYSDKPIAAHVKVSFPEGALTQWYPAAKEFAPRIGEGVFGLGPNPPRYVDPLVVPQCIAHGHEAKNGLLDWGNVEILPPDAKVDLPDAPLDQFTWSHARAVKANALRVTNPGGEKGQSERFLFYRGLGNFPPPATITWGKGMSIHAEDAIASVFVLNVGTTNAGFVQTSEGIEAGKSIGAVPPAQDMPIDTYVDKLGIEIVKALDKTGLFHDESMAMVNTWRRQWFKTPGVRVLYLASPQWIDQKIPLSITPTPDTIKRAMVIREEVLTPEIESSDVSHLADFNSDPSKAKAYFDAMGRFAEPRLRRAIAIQGTSPEAEKYLGTIAKMNTSAGAGE